MSIEFKVGDAVELKADLYEHAEEHSPGGYLARKGERLIVRKLWGPDALSAWTVSVSHESRTDGLTFSVAPDEIFLTPNVPHERQAR